MQVDIKGKINEKKLAYSQALLPVFEAIVNSIQAIEEYSATKPGLIEVDIMRSPQIPVNFERQGITREKDIIGFTISDNGIGFNTKNYESFNHAHSTYKKGGKGVGRFTWLRAFDRVIIESSYKEDDGWYLRKFRFEMTIGGIEGETKTPITDNELRKHNTTIKLVDLKNDYIKWINSNPEDIALRIIEHNFIYFLQPNCPRISLNDGNNKIIVNDSFSLYTGGNNGKIKEFKIQDDSFKLSIVNVYNNKVDNKIHYCANYREVESDKISMEIPEFDNFLVDAGNKKFSIAAYVEGSYLDRNVNEERTSINFHKGSVEFPDQVPREVLCKEVISILHKEFEDQINRLSEERFEKVKEFVATHPRYKQLLKYKPEELKKIPSTLTDDRMELEVFKVQQALEFDVKKEAKQAIAFIEKDQDIEDFISNKGKILSKIIEVGNAKLSDYIIHRKLVLEMFDRMLKYGAAEKAVHNLIFPLKNFSDDLAFEDHNLWMLDEKLSYHKYLASDKSFKQIDVIDSDSKDRPDIIIFNKPFAFVNDEKPYNSIVLIEFKKPMRDDYTDNENPITQINKYVREITEGRAKDKDQRGFDYREKTPIYAYIICDLTENLKSLAKDAGYTLLPNGNGYFSFNNNYNMYIEIMSFDKILKDSKDRNRVLFEKLNLS